MTTTTAAKLAVHIDGRPVTVAVGTSVAAALRIADAPGMGIARRSVQGEARAPFCGMGVCQECRVGIDGRRRLACQTACAEGMQIRTLS